jgi:LDH2 family malate/lactate/ureidoglycolate dehydrogenase
MTSRAFTAGSSSSQPGYVHVPIETAQETTALALKNIGWDKEDASLQVEIMVAAELCGNNQGLVKMYQPKLMAPSPDYQGKPVVERETSTTAVINARQSPGMLAAVTAADYACQVSPTLPLRMVTAYNSSTSSGQLAYYVERMVRRTQCVALAFCNSPEFVAAAPGGKPVLGTNPLAVAMPTAAGAPFVVRTCVRARASKECWWSHIGFFHFACAV